MKKRIFVGLFVISLVLVLFYGVSKAKTNSEVKLSTLTMENVEALASSEGISIDINWGQNYCVCKHGQCRKGRWISFRRRCAGTPSSTHVHCASSFC